MIGTDGIRASTHGHETDQFALFQPLNQYQSELSPEELAQLEDIDEDVELEIPEDHLRNLHETSRQKWLRKRRSHRPDPNSSVLVPSSPEKTPPTVAEIKLDPSDAPQPAVTFAEIDFAASYIAPERPCRPLPLIPAGRALNVNLQSFATAKTDTCRYLIDTGSQHFFCAEIVKENSSYCPEHHALCMVKPTKSQEKSLARHLVDDGYILLKATRGSEPAELTL